MVSTLWPEAWCVERWVSRKLPFPLPVFSPFSGLTEGAAASIRSARFSQGGRIFNSASDFHTHEICGHQICSFLFSPKLWYSLLFSVFVRAEWARTLGISKPACYSQTCKCRSEKVCVCVCAPRHTHVHMHARISVYTFFVLWPLVNGPERCVAISLLSSL